MSVTTWFPDDSISDHNDQAIREDSDFFCPPPPEIGSIKSAESTLRRDSEPTAVTARRVGTTIAACAVVWILWYLISLCNWQPSQISALLAWGAAAVAIIGLITWLHQKPRYVCSYVGEWGVARFNCYGSRDRLTRSEVFPFSEGEVLRASLRSIKVNLAYVHTEYDYAWTDASSKRRYRLHGRHHSESGRKVREDDYGYARAAQLAWSHYLMPKALEKIRTNGLARFTITHGRSVEVGPGRLAVNGKTLPLEKTRIRLDRGFLSFRIDTGKLGPFRRHKSHTIKCSDVANLYLLLMLLTDLFGCELRETGITALAGYHTLHPAA